MNSSPCFQCIYKLMVTALKGIITIAPRNWLSVSQVFKYIITIWSRFWGGGGGGWSKCSDEVKFL